MKTTDVEAFWIAPQRLPESLNITQVEFTLGYAEEMLLTTQGITS